ncbi:probable NAD(P)H dehydrogenase (quinone) FQR1-like 2 isoform X2 [Arachis hypogaea]|uniref:probable NAD(P)H dehydrogenase (quinone) FQR1-like 2 isoform X2 n=1 Tax=Arachis hypogaea TaxID=3818 RepID=UPI003B20F030
MKPFFASIGQLWKEQKLAEKPARFVISTGTQEQLIENRVLHLAKIMIFLQKGKRVGQGGRRMDPRQYTNWAFDKLATW